MGWLSSLSQDRQARYAAGSPDGRAARVGYSHAGVCRTAKCPVRWEGTRHRVVCGSRVDCVADGCHEPARSQCGDVSWYFRRIHWLLLTRVVTFTGGKWSASSE